jgi:hypothetical protein
MNPFSLIFGGITEAVKTLGGAWLQNKRVKMETEAKIQEKVVSGEIDYNTWAQRAGATSWKDEWLTIWTTGMVTACFIPRLQPYMEAGFKFLKDSCPDWFTWCFMGMYVAVFGLKGWKIFKNGGGGV